MEQVQTLEQAVDFSLATLNGLLQKPNSTLEEKKLIFVHLRLLFQLLPYLGYSLDITVPKYCSSCEGDRGSPQGEMQLPCGCFTCGPVCFMNKYCTDSHPKDVLCVVCGQLITAACVAEMMSWTVRIN